MLTKTESDNHEVWTFEEIKDHGAKIGNHEVSEPQEEYKEETW